MEERLSIPLPRALPAIWWGPPRVDRVILPIEELIRQSLIEPDLAAWLWLLIEHGASVILCAGPSGAGKSTLGAALTAFLSPDRLEHVVRGARDPLDTIAHRDPAKTTLLLAELSDHLPPYVWGPGAQRSFEQAARGAQLLGTLHAENPEGLVAELVSPTIGATPEQLRVWDIALFIEARRTSIGIYRRVERVVSLSLVQATGARWRSLATTIPGTAPVIDEKGFLQLVTRFWQDTSPESILHEYDHRAGALEHASR